MADMTSYQWAFVAAGCIGCTVALFHGVLMQKLMIRPILAGMKLPQSTRRLVPLLLHFSTVFWFLGGVALVVVPLFAEPPVMLATAIFVGAMYGFGAIGNFWGTGGRHPGWVLLALSVSMIFYGASALVN